MRSPPARPGRSTALDLLDRADELASEEAVAAASGGLRGLIEFANGDQEHAHRLLLRDTYAVTDPGTAAELACVAVRAGWSAGSPERQAEALHRLEKLAVDGDFPEAARLPVLEQWWGSGLKARPDEAVQGLMLTVSQTVTIDIVAGRWTEAAANAAETLRLAEEMKADHAASQCRNCLSWLAALRGDEQAVTDLTTRTLELSVPRGVRALTAAATVEAAHRCRAQLAGEGSEDSFLHALEVQAVAEHPFSHARTRCSTESGCDGHDVAPKRGCS